MSDPGEPRVYEALALPNEALTNGGVEILRAGLIDDALYVTARRSFQNHATWGEVLGEIARRIAAIYSLEDTDLTEKEITADIVEAFAAEMGLPTVKDETKGRPVTKRARPARKKSSKKAARKTAKRRKR